MTFPQQLIYVRPVGSVGNRTRQIGQSSLGGGCLNNFSSKSSAARFLHSRLCCGRWAIWHSLLQYLTNLHAVHALSLISASSPSPQLAHILDELISDDDVLLILWYMISFHVISQRGVIQVCRYDTDSLNNIK